MNHDPHEFGCGCDGDCDRPDACTVGGHHNLISCGDFARKFRLFAQLYKIRSGNAVFKGIEPV